ncbi:ABC transporter permease [Gorillibacterium sp. CAU 1737]|uniref:ABC transporter permease n=1 Tax=Gorillibacterium sp. CAU 1737 TaxID=3140362 RepID=UPI003260CD82
MLNLIRNENMKTYRRFRTWIMVLLLIGIVGFGAYQINHFRPDPANWKQESAETIKNYKSALNDNPSMQNRNYFEERIKLEEYRLEHDLIPPDNTLWGSVLDMSDLIVLVTIFTVVVAADSVAGEFTQGTVKMLLIRPHSRNKVLLSKYLSSLLFSLFLLIVLFGASYGFGGLFSGFDSASLPHLSVGSDGAVHESNMIVHTLSIYGLSCVNLLMTVTLAFMISTLFRSNSLAIALSIVVLLLSNTAIHLLKGYSWIKYYLFANTDLTQYLNDAPLRDDMTLTFSILVLVGYFIVMNLLTWTLFKKRDVAA